MQAFNQKCKLSAKIIQVIYQKIQVIDKKNANSSTTKMQAFNQKYKLSARIIQIIDKKI